MELHAWACAHGDGKRTEVLWSAATAREIVAEIARDIELGRMGRAQGLDLIDRVQQRAAPESDGAASAAAARRPHRPAASRAPDAVA